MVNPKLSVAILGQNGVYAYFSAAFLPILLGMFSIVIDKKVVIISSVVAVIVHFSMYYGKLPVPFTQATGENPGVAASVAIIISMLTGFLVHQLTRKKSDV